MTRIVLACLLSFLAAAASAQAPSKSPITPVSPTRGVKKVRTKPAPHQSEPVSSGRCEVGVIPATQDIFTVQKVGVTVFGNALTDVPVSWGLDDLIFARARIAAGSVAVRRISYARGAFDAYYHPQSRLFRNPDAELTALVRQIAGNTGCERYLLVFRGEGQFSGTNQKLSGIGIVSAGLFNHLFLFTYVGVAVFDGRTFEKLRDPNATVEGVLHGMFTSDENFRRIEDGPLPADVDTDANLREKMRGFLTERLDKILPVYFRPR